MATSLNRVGFSGLLLLLACGSAPADEKIPEVPVAHPVVREVTDYADFTGRTDAAETVHLRARVTGYLVKTPFQEGADVKQGDVLFEIDPRPYRAELDRARATLNLAEARFKLADATQKRAAAGLAAGTTTREEFDKAMAERIEAEAAIAVAKVGREAAELNLEFTRVVAPINGRIGRRLVDPGNLVKADETTLGVLVGRDPMYVFFDVDEVTYLRLARTAGEGKFKALKVGIQLADEKGYPHAAMLDFEDNRMDPQTGKLRVRGVLPNKEKLLLPGMFVRVRLAVSRPYKALLLPDELTRYFTSPGNGSMNSFVYVVNDKNEIEQRYLKLGPLQPDGLRVIAEGLKEKDRVIMGGYEKIAGLGEMKPGTTVKPQQTTVPETKPER